MLLVVFDCRILSMFFLMKLSLYFVWVSCIRCHLHQVWVVSFQHLWKKNKWTENWRLRQRSEVNCIIAATPPVSLGIQLTVELLPEMFPSNHVIWGWKKPEVLVMPEIRGNNLVSFFFNKMLPKAVLKTSSYGNLPAHLFWCFTNLEVSICRTKLIQRWLKFSSASSSL